MTISPVRDAIETATGISPHDIKANAKLRAASYLRASGE
jgi:hypothetical protein